MNSALRIAVADDEQDVRDYYQRVLPRLGHQLVAVARTGRSWSSRAGRPCPDLVITDIKMPDMDGIEAAEEISREEPIPVILVSAYHRPQLFERARGDHILAYLVKPTKQADLEAAIAIAMQRFEQFQALRRTPPTGRQALEDRKVIERAKGLLMKRAGLDEEEAFRRLREAGPRPQPEARRRRPGHPHRRGAAGPVTHPAASHDAPRLPDDPTAGLHQELMELLEQLPEGPRATGHAGREGQDARQGGLVDWRLVLLRSIRVSIRALQSAIASTSIPRGSERCFRRYPCSSNVSTERRRTRRRRGTTPHIPGWRPRHRSGSPRGPSFGRERAGPAPAFSGNPCRHRGG